MAGLNENDPMFDNEPDNIDLTNPVPSAPTYTE
jgi:hypothetical protein